MIGVWFIPRISPAAPNLDISPNDPAYPVLRRAQTRTDRTLYSQNFPLRIEEVWQYLTGPELSLYDRAYIKQRHPFGGSPLVRWEDKKKGHSFHLSPFMDVTYADSTLKSLKGGLGLWAWGTVTEDITFYARNRAFTERVDEDVFYHQFDPDEGESCSVESGDEPSDERTCARFEHYLLADLPWFQLKLGRDHLHMGPGYFSSLTAQRSTAPYYLAEVRLDFAPWLHLDNTLLRMVDSDHDVRKYAHVHRFEFRPGRGWSLAFQDIVIYQDRDVDPKYLLPLSPLAFSEDNTGGRDNDGLQLDALYTGLPNLSVWGELFIDDLLGATSLFDDHWENRWAALAGFQLTSPWPLIDADLVVEWSRVEPWTYNGRQDHTSFRHFDRHTASKLGPDSRSWDLRLAYRPLPGLEFSEHVEFNAKGTQPGAVLGTIHKDTEHGTTKEFLEEPSDESQVYTLAARGFWRRYYSAEVYYSVITGDGAGNRFGGALLLMW